MRPFKCAIFSIIIMSHGISLASSLLLLDTAQGEPYQYQTMIDLAQNAGFDVKYKPIAELIDEDITEKSTQPDSIFFLFSTEFLKQMNTSPIAEKILATLELFASMPNKLVGLIFPSGLTQGVGPFSKIFEKLGIKITKRSLKIVPGNTTVSMRSPLNEESIIDFMQKSNELLAVPPSARGIDFDTMIFRPQPAKAQISSVQTLENTKLPIALLPLKTNFSKATKKILPNGLYWHNPIKNNHVFIGSIGALNFSSIAEDFRLTPADFNQRLDMLQSAQETFWELSHITKQGIDIKTILLSQSPTLPKNMLSMGKTTNHSSKIKCPWMDISMFFDNVNDKDQDKIISYIFESDFTHLWLSIAPNWYYSPIAVRQNTTGPHGPNGIKSMVNAFTKKLLTKAKETGKKIPKIMIGFEIANNLRGNNIPYKNMAYDMYGNSYKDAPAPLSNTFWNEEVILPLYKFAKDWKLASNSIPISGVILDLEMYVKSSCSFLSTMGFDQETFNKFKDNRSNQIYEATLKALSPGLASHQDPINYLQGQRSLQKYFDFLQNDAERLGNKLRIAFNKLIPNGEIGCYAPNISPSWFYKGFYKGLSKNPIMLLTFNAEFNSHKPWLMQNNINVRHCYALMLSKIQSKADSTWLNRLAQHDGVWLNRFSTLTEKYISHPEHTPLSQSPKALKNFLKAISNS